VPEACSTPKPAGTAQPAAALSVAEAAGDGPTVGGLIDEVTSRLRSGADADPRREARDIIAAILGVSRLWPSVHRGDQVADEAARAIRAAADRRRRGMPLAYAVGRAAFRHLTLDVDQRVLIPRPETELLVDLVLTAAGVGGVAVDVGTGSGAIALALATEGRFDLVVGTDVSTDALVVAAGNARRLSSVATARIVFRQGSYLDPVRDLRARAVVANPPYISYDEVVALPASVRAWEPPVALLTGDGGMAATAAIARGAADILEPGGVLALEVDARRAWLAAELVAASRRYADVSVRLDLTGRERFIVAIRSTRS
jgi:release factor glutamine methyltransferase